MIYINDIPSFRAPEHYEITPDERVEKIEVIGGIEIQDLGHVAEGDAYSIECLFSPTNWARFHALWETRAKVTFTDTAGRIFHNMRIVMRKYYPDRDYPQYMYATFELWRK